MSTDELADQLAIQALLSEYAWGNDVRDIDVIAQCFSADGSFGLQIAGSAAVGPVRGRPAVAEFMRAALVVQSDQRRHVISNLKLTRRGDDEFEARSYLTLLVTDNGVTRVATSGWYEDRIIREGGRWVFGDRWLWLDGQF